MDCCDQEFLRADQDQPPKLRRCFNIPASAPSPSCMPLTRSDPICSNDAFREQMNAITAFVDGSNVYGSDDTRTRRLRKLSDGLMKTHQELDQTIILPTRQQCGFATNSAHLPGELVTGDVRALVQPTLASMHTLFLAEHNRIAKSLKEELERVNAFPSDPSAGDELVFQETRKIIGALLQRITYKDYLPVILGNTAMSAHNLDISGGTDYNQNVDPSILNEFATVAYRFGHSQIANKFHGVFPWRLRTHYFQKPAPDFADGFITGIGGKSWMHEMKGASNQTCPKNDLVMGDHIRKFLFGEEDLPARNIQRGREHGIPAYGILREKCGLAPLVGTTKPVEIQQETWEEILLAYGNTADSVADIDAFVGGLAEDAPEDGVVGSLFACIIGEQFKNLMLGDRYFFTHSDQNNARGLKQRTKQAVLQRTLAHIICDNTGNIIGLQNLQENVFKIDATSNPNVQCGDTPAIDISGIVQDILDSDFPGSVRGILVKYTVRDGFEKNTTKCDMSSAHVYSRNMQVSFHVKAVFLKLSLFLRYFFNSDVFTAKLSFNFNHNLVES